MGSTNGKKKWVTQVKWEFVCLDFGDEGESICASQFLAIGNKNMKGSRKKVWESLNSLWDALCKFGNEIK